MLPLVFWASSVWLATVAAMAPEPLSVEHPTLQLQISEFYVDPPQRGDQDEYVEIQGLTKSEVLSDISNAKAEGEYTYYLLLLENEGAEAGKVDKIIPLTGVKLSREGFAWFYGAGGEKYQAQDGYRYDGKLENSGGTLLLVAVPFGHRAPEKTHDYDATTDSVAILGGDWDPNWIVLDSVGVMCRKSDVDRGGALYARVNFAAGDFAEIATPSDSINVNTNVYRRSQLGAFDEIEYVGRIQGSTWIAANLTDSGPNWSDELRNYSIADDDENDGEPECVDQNGLARYEAFTDVTVTLGEVNLCTCGKSPPVSPPVAAADGPVPTLADPAPSEPEQSASN